MKTCITTNSHLLEFNKSRIIPTNFDLNERTMIIDSGPSEPSKPMDFLELQEIQPVKSFKHISII